MTKINKLHRNSILFGILIVCLGFPLASHAQKGLDDYQDEKHAAKIIALQKARIGNNPYLLYSIDRQIYIIVVRKSSQHVGYVIDLKKHFSKHRVYRHYFPLDHPVFSKAFDTTRYSYPYIGYQSESHTDSTYRCVVLEKKGFVPRIYYHYPPVYFYYCPGNGKKYGEYRLCMGVTPSLIGRELEAAILRMGFNYTKEIHVPQ